MYTKNTVKHNELQYDFLKIQECIAALSRQQWLAILCEARTKANFFRLNSLLAQQMQT